ncbi:MAG: ABC transporter permease subunit [Pirellulaceae bacterium]|nr:ABC transporter permease subunit [Pirellulaceae bacterium]
MPIHDVGYRRWQGTQSGFGTRWIAITNKGFEIAFRSQWVRRMMFLAWLPAIYFGAALFFFERTFENREIFNAVAELNQAAEMAERGVHAAQGFDDDDDEARPPGAPARPRIDLGPEGLDTEQKRRNATMRMLSRTPLLGGLVALLGGSGSEEVFDAIVSQDDTKLRRVVWSWFILKFITTPQGFALLLLIGWVAPPMIAKDLRTKAFLLYFSRPLSKFSYILGKLMVLVVMCSMITTLPALILYGCGIALSPNLTPLYATWDLPLRIIVVGLMHSIPASLLALMLSAITTESRYAMFGWYATWTLGFVTWRILSLAYLSQNQDEGGDVPFDPLAPLALEDGGGWIYVSLYDSISLVQSLGMGVGDFNLQAQLACVMLPLVSLSCFAIIWRQLSRATLG